MRVHEKQRKQEGIALVSVLLIMTVVLILAFTFSFVAVSERRSVATGSVVDEAVQVADAASERARLEVMATFESSNYSTGNFLKNLKHQVDGGAVTFASLSGVNRASVNARDTGWQVHDVVMDDLGKSGWVDLAATAKTPRGTQTVIRSVGFGVPPIFELTLLSETTNCMYCHLRVNGDVGSLEFFRPGWGVEGGGGYNTGEGSHVNGNVYASKAVSADATTLGPKKSKVNGAEIDGRVEANSTSPKLPSDTDRDGEVNWPAIEREEARKNADGTVSVSPGAADGALMIGTPLGGSATNLTAGNLNSVSKVYNGNLILKGTKDNPINLNNSLFVEGDVVIQGVVTGTGTLYAGRNIYIAGDLETLTPADEIGKGVCGHLKRSDPGAADSCAKANIVAKKDTLNLGARGNVVIGDYTEYRADGELLPWSSRQSSDYYRRQFGFGLHQSGVNERFDKAYHKTTGDELTFVDPDKDGQGSYINVDGAVIGNACSGAVVCRRAVAGLKEADAKADAYSYSFRPGTISNTGNFAPWLSDEQYRSLLGTETFSYNTWRWNIPDYAAAPDPLAQLTADLKAALEGDPTKGAGEAGRTGLEIDEAALRAVVNGTTTSLDIIDVNKGKVGEFEQRPAPGLANFRAVIAADARWETQVNRIDAFLYANQRVAGKVSMQAAAVQGGLVAKKVGVLAPGRRLKFSTYQNDINPETACSDPSDPYYVKGAEHCSLTLNYDYRMRNGGWGFDLLSAEIGKTVAWRLAESKSERVTW